jgi:hypothetical protein
MRKRPESIWPKPCSICGFKGYSCQSCKANLRQDDKWVHFNSGHFIQHVCLECSIKMKKEFEIEMNEHHPYLVLPKADFVNEIKITSCPRPKGNDGDDDSGEFLAAKEMISYLDRFYSKEQVHNIAKWIHYLSTQA